TSAISRPTNAKISTMAVWPTADGLGTAVQRRYSGRMNQMPTATSTIRGNSFATVAVSTRPTPRRTPRTLIAASAAKRITVSIAGPIGVCTAGQSAPTDPANALVTDADANVAIRKYRTPARNPMNVPRATSTYAYRPPVSDTRLPAAAKQQTISAIRPAQ